MNKKNILVTGGAGFIGSFLVDKLVEDGHNVTIYDNLEPQIHHNKIPDYLNKDARFIQADILNYETLKKSVKDKEIIFHFASMVGVAQSQYEIKKYIDVNVSGTANLLNILVNEKTKVQKLIIAGSMTQYGEGVYLCEDCDKVRPPLRSEEQLKKNIWDVLCPNCKKIVRPIFISEDEKLNPNSIYALSKQMQEQMCLLIGKTFKIPTVSLRFFNVYGPRQSLSNPYTGVTAIFISRIKNNKPPIVFEDGEQSRDFIYVEDVVLASILAMEKEEANYQIFNVGSGKPIKIKDVAVEIAKLYKKNIQPKILKKFRKNDIRHCNADITKIKKMLGFEPKISFKEGLQRLTQWSKTEKATDRYNLAYQELISKGLM